MSGTTIWIILAVVAVFALGYVFAMRNLLQRSRDEFKKVDRSKLRKWEKED